MTKMLRVPDVHGCFDAHFPGNPIVPGALLLNWTIQHLSLEYGQHSIAVRAFKFLRPLKPGARCEFIVTMTASDDKNTVSVDISSAQQLIAQGKFECRPVSSGSGEDSA